MMLKTRQWKETRLKASSFFIKNYSCSENLEETICTTRPSVYSWVLDLQYLLETNGTLENTKRFHAEIFT